MRMPIIGSDVHLNFDAGEDKLDVYPAKVIEVHTPYCVSVVYWNRGGTQCTKTSVGWGDTAEKWQWPELRKKPTAPTPSEPSAD